MDSLSVIILAKNEERNILHCIQSLQWCKNIILIDDYSVDKTPEIAAKLGAKIYRRALVDDFSNQRNFALTKATTEWVLFVDADEVVDEKLAREIQKVIKDTACNGFLVPRNTSWNGKAIRFGEFINFSLLRLARKNSGKWEGKIHEKWKVNGKIGELHASLIHTQDGGIERFLKKINSYSSIRAAELFEQKKKSDFLVIVLFPTIKFFVNYLLKFGFVDKIPGLINALGMSFYTFLVRAKLWLLWNETTKKV